MSNQIDKMAPPASASTHVAKPMRKASAPVADPAQQAPNLNQPVATATRLGHSFGNIGVHYGAPPVGSQPIIQPKLTIGPVNDPYEQEADRVAAQVVNQVNTPTAQRQEKPEDEEKLQTKPLISSLQRQETPEDEEKLQTKPITDSLQRQEEPEKEDEQVQTKSLAASLQRQEKPEDEEKVQTKPLIPSLQRQEMPEEEEKLQTKPIADLLQRQEEPEQEEEQVQTKSLAASLQRQEKREDEEKLQTKPLLNPVQRQAEKEEDKLQTKPQLQRQADGSMAATPALESAISGLRGSGQSLPDSTRQPMERAFGADFSKVKVHTDAQADQLNRSVQARAFTTGQDIFFRQGEHSPNTPAGQELLAHELTHVVQQSRGVIRESDSKLLRQKSTKDEDPRIRKINHIVQEELDSFIPSFKVMLSAVISARKIGGLQQLVVDLSARPHKLHGTYFTAMLRTIRSRGSENIFQIVAKILAEEGIAVYKEDVALYEKIEEYPLRFQIADYISGKIQETKKILIGEPKNSIWWVLKATLVDTFYTLEEGFVDILRVGKGSEEAARAYAFEKDAVDRWAGVVKGLSEDFLRLTVVFAPIEKAAVQSAEKTLARQMTTKAGDAVNAFAHDMEGIGSKAITQSEKQAAKRAKDAAETTCEKLKQSLFETEPTTHLPEDIKQFTPEQSDLVEMAKRDKQRGGISAADMEAYKKLNIEAGDKGFTAPGAVRGPEIHPPRSPQSKPGPAQRPHGHVGPVNHIPVKP